ncbi:MAG: glycosyltransferase family 2 protein [Fimbriimonadaceae bacterium]
MGSPEPSQITVIIVSYESAQFLSRCLASLPEDVPILVVDNASTDNSVEVLKGIERQLEVIESPVNMGLSRAANLALDRCETPWVMWLNPDTCLSPGAFEALWTTAGQKGVIAVAPRLQHPDGSLQLSTAKPLTLWAVLCEQFMIEPLLRRSARHAPYWNTQFLDSPTRVDQAMGACLLFPTDFRLDPQFFLYCEDTDLCKRLGEKGEIWYQPEAVVEHELGASSEAARWQAIALYNSGKELYFSVHHGALSSFACLLLNRVGALLRVVLALPLMVVSPKRAARRFGTFWRVLFAPLNLQRKKLRIVEESLQERRRR